ncbi:MAG TPA: hypothetical protein VEX68_22725 [Bryobacteraceae bacterium]|nr:hypothetical protein [Bryobacteraceae bacterium]
MGSRLIAEGMNQSIADILYGTARQESKLGDIYVLGFIDDGLYRMSANRRSGRNLRDG